MKIYCVFGCCSFDYVTDCYDLLKVFSTEEKASQFISEIEESNEYEDIYSSFEVDVLTLDEK